jgi:WS/DGAT C-terminal domain
VGSCGQNVGTAGAAFNITLVCYGDSCNIGINIDTNAAPDYDVLLVYLRERFDEIIAPATTPGHRHQAD